MTTIPAPVFDPPFRITRASHAVLAVRDLEASRAFYTDVAGLVVTAETSDALYLRGIEEACHHSLVLRKGTAAECSRIGLRGEEDLGGGLKAEFNIESGLALDTGTADSAFWGRRAVVGLQGGFGSLLIGREYSPIASVAAASDIFGQGYFGTNLSAFTSGRLSRRLSNSVSYRTPSIGGVRASLVASPSEGVSSASRVLGTAEPVFVREHARARHHLRRRAVGRHGEPPGLVPRGAAIGLAHARGDGGAGLAVGRTHQLAGFDAGHFDLHVDAVE